MNFVNLSRLYFEVYPGKRYRHWPNGLGARFPNDRTSFESGSGLLHWAFRQTIGLSQSLSSQVCKRIPTNLILEMNLGCLGFPSRINK